MIIGLFRLLYYFVTIYFIYAWFSRIRIAGINVLRINGLSVSYQRNSQTFSNGVIIIVSISLGFYSVICGTLREGTDRWNYTDNFVNQRWLNVGGDSVGLEYLEKILSKISTNGYFLVFVIAFLSSCLTLVALNLFDADRKTLLLLGISQYFTYSFYLFKQTLAISIVAISIALLLKKRYVLSVILVLIAGLFHVSAYIVLPIYLVLYFSKNRSIRIAGYIIGIAVFRLFFTIKDVGMDYISQYFPRIASQAIESLGMATEAGINYMTGIKGIPYYLITLYAALNFKNVKGKIGDFEKLYMMSFAASVFTGLSIYFYWMYRFGAYFYLPSFILVQEVHKTSKTNQWIYYLAMISCCFFTARYLFLKFIVDGGF